MGRDTNGVEDEDVEQIVETVCRRLDHTYVFADRAQGISNGLRQRLANGSYSDCTTPQEIADRLNLDLTDLGQDNHLGVRYDPQMAAEMRQQEAAGEEDAYLTPQMVARERRGNYGFRELRILEGNIGYMDLRIFFPPKYAGETAVAAMTFLSNCDALIIDLRNNGGGWDYMVRLLLSYFFDNDELIHFGTAYTRSEDKYEQLWSLPYVPGKLRPKVPLYVLISRSTFSAAEAFSYDLKHLGRATLVGEQTRGGANPVDIQAIGGAYVLYVPSMRPINLVTGTNWEGIGVEPDIEVEAEKALEVAHMEALLRLREQSSDETENERYRWVIDGLHARIDPAAVPRDVLRSYVGEFGDRTISLEGGELHYQWGNRARKRMIAMSQDRFLVEDYGHVRVRFIREGSAAGIEERYDTGRILRFMRV